MRLSIIAACALFAAMLGLVACSSSDETRYVALSGTGVGIDAESMDKAIAPGDDFYGYANGTWLQNTTIPDDAAEVGRHSAASDLLATRLLAIVQEIVGSPQPKGSDTALIREFHRAFMNEAAIEKAGAQPVRTDIDRILAIENVTDLSRELGAQAGIGGNPVLDSDATSDSLIYVAVMPATNDGVMVPYLIPAGLGLPSPSMYTGASVADRRIENGYTNYIATVLRWSGRDSASSRARAVATLEQQLAALHGSDTPSVRDFGNATALSYAELTSNAPGMDWDAFLKAAGLAGQDRLVAPDAEVLKAYAILVMSQPVEVWQDWLIFHQVNRYATMLPRKIADAHFRVYGQLIAGVKTQPSREELAVRQIAHFYGNTVGRIYAERHFPDDQRQDVTIIAQRVRDAMADDVRRSDVLSAAARDAMIDKLDNLHLGIGASGKVAPLKVRPPRDGSAYARSLVADRASRNADIAKVGKIVDSDAWSVNAHEFRAIYLPLQNAINIPTVWLQPPYYSPDADPAANYGALGAVIGHQIAHAIDSGGAAFDADGRSSRSWTAQDAAQVDTRVMELAEQFSTYEPFAGSSIDGQRTLRENAADLAGLAAAYDAYRQSLDGKEPPVIDGLTGDQRFFIAYAQSMAYKLRESTARRILAEGTVTLPRYRALTVRNIDAWYRAFDVQPDAALYLEPDRRVAVW